MKTFKELCDGKVWKAIQFMIDGLKEQSDRPDFIIDMSTFGKNRWETCSGCAATCAIQKAVGKNLSINVIHSQQERAEFLEVDLHDMDIFEECIDQFRRGYPNELFDYFEKEIYEPDIDLPILNTENWISKIDVYHSYAHKLKALDI